MTIKQFAKERGITTQAVYSKLKTAGIDISTLKDGNSAELSEDGLSTLEKLFAKNSGNSRGNLNEKQSNFLIESLQEQIKSLQSEVERWKGQAESWEQMAKQAQETAQQAQVTAQQAQALQAQTVKLFQAKALPAPRKTIFQRLFKRNTDQSETIAGESQE